jgi:hypothetical protein
MSAAPPSSSLTAQLEAWRQGDDRELRFAKSWLNARLETRL